MNKKIESFLEEIHSLPDEKLDKQQLRSNLEMLLSSNPDISIDPAFKQKLQTRLDTIVEFKQGNSVVKKISYLKVLFPVFACLVLVVGVFSMVDIKLFNGDTSNIAPIQSEEALIEDINPEQQTLDATPQEPTADTIIQPEPLTIKQQILARAAEKKAAKLQNAIVQDAPLSKAKTIDTTEPTIETQDDIPEDNNSEIGDESSSTSSFSTQLKGTTSVNDIPEADLNIDAGIFNDDVNILESLLGPLEDFESTGTGSQSTGAEDSEIAESIFTQSCEAFEGQIETQSGSMVCVKDQVNICSRADYENTKCEYLE